MLYFLRLALLLITQQAATLKTDKVDQIEKGVTTKEQVADWFGEPYSKTVINGNQVKWLYFYSQGTSKAQSYVFTMKVQTEGLKKH